MENRLTAAGDKRQKVTTAPSDAVLFEALYRLKSTQTGLPVGKIVEF